MTPSPFFEAFFNGQPARNLRLVVARGAAPLPVEENLHLVALLVRDQDPEIAAQATQTLENWSAEDLLVHLRSRTCPRPLLEHFAGSARPDLLEAVILNPATPGSAIEDIASRVSGPLLEAVLYNRTRLLENPGILARVKRNPAITQETERVVREIEVEFFGDKKVDYKVSGTDESETLDAEIPLLEPELPPDDLSLEGLPVDPEAREGFVLEKLARMTVRQKIQMALLGPREARTVLVRDTNRQIARAVLQSPKLTDTEVEGFAAMRNISDEILREIGNNRTWLRSYAVALNLVKNPKTPPLISQRLISRLHTKDLQLLSRDRGVPEIVRRNAQRTVAQRTDSRGMG